MSATEIPLPESLDGQEFARLVQTPDRKLVFVVDATSWLEESDDPTVIWGFVLVDLARHVANSLEGRLHGPNGEVPRAMILEAIREHVEAEWESEDEVRRVTDG